MDHNQKRQGISLKQHETYLFESEGHESDLWIPVKSPQKPQSERWKHWAEIMNN